MAVTNSMIPIINQAFNFKLLPFQVHYILGNSEDLGATRGSGRTTAYCIRLALSEGEPIDLRHPERYSDMPHLKLHYARDHFKREFVKIRNILEHNGFNVRQVKM